MADPIPVLITGSARRLGREMALHLAGPKYRVLAHYRSSKEEAESLADEVRSRGGCCNLYEADLSQPKDAAGLGKRVVKEHRSVPYLINGASEFTSNRLSDADSEAFIRSLKLEALGPWELIRTLAADTTQGAAVNMLDTRISDYDPNHGTYAAAKRLLFDLTRILSMELAPHFRVNGVAPGLAIPDSVMSPKVIEASRQATPLKKIGGVDQICRAAEFLLEADMVTGQVIFVDGGRHLKGSFYGL